LRLVGTGTTVTTNAQGIAKNIRTKRLYKDATSMLCEKDGDFSFCTSSNVFLAKSPEAKSKWYCKKFPKNQKKVF